MGKIRSSVKQSGVDMFKVRKIFGMHEGGTKFYQVFQFTHVTTNESLVVTHWGAYADGAELTPKCHGQSKPEWSRGGSLFNVTVKGKEKRGYVFEGEEWYTLSDLSAMRRVVTDLLKPEIAKSVIVRFESIEIELAKKEAEREAAERSKTTGVVKSPEWVRKALDDDAFVLDEIDQPEVKVETSTSKHWGTW